LPSVIASSSIGAVSCSSCCNTMRPLLSPCDQLVIAFDYGLHDTARKPKCQ
jgi:hypothetical protein